MKRKETGKEKARLSLYTAYEPDNLVVSSRAEEVIASAIRETLAYENFTQDVEISLTFCDGPYIRELNREYRNKDTETDVLSFPLFDEDEEDPIEEETLPLGDIVLNIDRAAEQARELSHSTLREMAFLAIHSTLHLLGYDHERSEEEDADMCARQREIIAALSLTEDFEE